MNDGVNIWIDAETGKKIKSATRPAEGEWFAAYAQSRVRGDHYTPYQGKSEWVRAANAGMKSAAAYNFQFRKGI